MTDFEKLQKIAKEEFSVTIVRSDKKSSFKTMTKRQGYIFRSKKEVKISIVI